MTTLNVSENSRPLLADYCQFLLASFHNFTQTYLVSDHTDRWSHDQLNRLLREERISDRAQRNHIACCLWVWVSLTRAARTAGQTIYQLKESLLDDYIRQQLHKPTISINIA